MDNEQIVNPIEPLADNHIEVKRLNNIIKDLTTLIFGVGRAMERRAKETDNKDLLEFSGRLMSMK